MCWNHVSAAGQDCDIAQASTLIEGFDSDMVIADQAYDARDLIQMIPGMRAGRSCHRLAMAINNESLITTGTKNTTWLSASSIELNSFAV